MKGAVLHKHMYLVNPRACYPGISYLLGPGRESGKVNVHLP